MNAVRSAVLHGVLMGAGHEYRAVRARADGHPVGELARWDALVIEHLVDAEDDEVWPALLEDVAAEPLSQWWWHLGAIRAGTFPADALPDHLRPLYTNASSAA